jgi:hypothetical protein
MHENLPIEDGGVGVRDRVGQEFSLLCEVQTGSGVHPTSYTMGTGGSFLGSIAATDHSPPTSAEVKKTWVYTNAPHTPSCRSA